MSINVPPPEFQFSTLFYNPNFWITSSTTLSQSVANTLYLRKTVTDSASALETFNAGIKSSSYDVTNPSLIKYMYSSQTADANLFENLGSSSTLKLGNQVTTQSVHCSKIDCNGTTINNATAPLTGNISICNSQTTGQLTIGSSGRTGAINIYRSFTPLYTAVPTSAEIGYRTQIVTSLSYTFSTGNPATITTITSGGAGTSAGTWLYQAIFALSTISNQNTFSINTSAAYSTSLITSLSVTQAAGFVTYANITGVLQLSSNSSVLLLMTSGVAQTISPINVFVTRIA